MAKLRGDASLSSIATGAGAGVAALRTCHIEEHLLDVEVNTDNGTKGKAMRARQRQLEQRYPSRIHMHIKCQLEEQRKAITATAKLNFWAAQHEVCRAFYTQYCDM